MAKSLLQEMKAQLKKKSLLAELELEKNKPQATTISQGVKGIPGFSLGALKGAASTATNLGEMYLKEKTLTSPVLLPLSQTGVGKKIASEAKQVLEEGKKKYLTPQGTAEKVGFGAEQVAEMFTPTGIESAGAKLGIKLAEKSPKGFKILASVAPKILATGSELAGKTALQTGGDIKEMEKAALFGALSVPVGESLSAGLRQLPKVAQTLEKINLRLTPVQKQNIEKKINETVDFMIKNKIVGTPTQRYEKIVSKYEEMEPKLQKFLENEAKDRTIARDSILEKLEGLKSKYQNERDVLAIEKQIDSAIETFKAKYPEQISLNRLNDFKRSTYSNAYNKAGEKVLDTVEHDIGDIAKNSIEEATKGLKIDGRDIAEFNKEYGTLITARKLLKTAKSRAEIGLIGKLISMSIGGGVGSFIGGPIGAAVGTGLGTGIAKGVAGTAARSLTGQALLGASKIPLETIIKSGAKAIPPLIRK